MAGAISPRPHKGTVMKTEPTADLRSFATTLWQLYVALTDSGFNEHQALVVIGQTIAAATMNGEDDD